MEPRLELGSQVFVPHPSTPGNRRLWRDKEGVAALSWASPEKSSESARSGLTLRARAPALSQSQPKRLAATAPEECWKNLRAL
ncbi:hypothetical protein NDU88_011892 [Pleurodeles waltl]|uniref:Uncharacterized protein n=1 Tax=Pleurodeles waltl TaxID=8319 RepID=A0AAV7QZ45_PLEWA|nr:hypothetical protein NDU88_011892 [Pleurodeles waltl]